MTNQPTDAISVAPDAIGAIVATTQGDELVLGIRADCPPPIGRIHLWLGREAAIVLANDLTNALSLDDAQMAKLRDHVNQGDHQVGGGQ